MNSLLAKHGAEGYDVFKDCIDHLLVPEKAFFVWKKEEKKRALNWFFWLKLGEVLIKMVAWFCVFTTTSCQSCSTSMMKILIWKNC